MKRRLLVVDDEPDMVDFVSRVFRSDFDVTRAAGGAEALEVLAAETFDVLVTDQKMPHVSGLELLERIGAAHRGMAKVLLSGFTDVPEVERLVARGLVDGYVVKPVNSQTLQEEVEKAVARRAGQGK